MNVVLSWSGGKDSSLALHEIMKTDTEVKGLLTTITKDYGRVSMHGVRRESDTPAIGIARASSLRCINTKRREQRNI